VKDELPDAETLSNFIKEEDIKNFENCADFGPGISFILLQTFIDSFPDFKFNLIVFSCFSLGPGRSQNRL